MPNYVKNMIRWRNAPSNEEVLAAMIPPDSKYVKFDHLVPLPEGMEDDPDAKDECWGTIYSCFGSDVVELKSETYVRLETGWTTPRKWMTALSAKFPGTTFRLDYSSGASEGTYFFLNGEWESYDWPVDPKVRDRAINSLHKGTRVHIKQTEMAIVENQR